MFACLNRSLITPPDSVRRYDHDVPEVPVGMSVQRVALLALPFVGMHKPCGFVIAMGMGTCRVATHLVATYRAGSAGQWGTLSYEAVQTMLAVIALATTCFHFTLGSAVTAGADACTAFVQACKYLRDRQYDKAAEE